jgi:hypothetical protein
MIDYKENFYLSILMEQYSKAFYEKRPVTCLSSIAYKRETNDKLKKRITTIISPIVSHTGSMTALCV